MNHMKLYDELMKLNLIKDNKYIQVFGEKKIKPSSMTQETEMLLVVNYKIQCHYHRYDECVIM